MELDISEATGWIFRFEKEVVENNAIAELTLNLNTQTPIIVLMKSQMPQIFPGIGDEESGKIF